MISHFAMNISCNGKLILILCTAVILAFFVAMDTHLYFTLQQTSLIHQDLRVPGHFSPFKPLSVKLIMTDPYNHYIIGPSAEYFDEITSFSKVFYFITPNMISLTHLVTSFISAKIVASESLCTRRLGVILYQFRVWLDDLDGVVYRSHTNQRGNYQSNHNTLGYFVDIYSDIIGCVVFMFGILFYLFKSLPMANGKQAYTPLPLTKPQEVNSGGQVSVNSPNRKFNFNILNIFGSTDRPTHGYTKKFIFYKVLCVGMCVFVASGTWDKVVEKYTAVFQTDLQNPVLESIQTEALHSGSLWLIIYLWRIWEGQCIIHMICIAVFIDRVWEFFTFFQYLGYVIIFFVNLLSYIHISTVRNALKM